MYGAIIGDMVGSPYEFDEVNKSKDIDLFRKDIRFTDDTVMTVAIAVALIKAGSDAPIDKIKENVTGSMQFWGHEYPNAGYGSGFHRWLSKKDAKPYGSFGNGSAMRVSPAGWLYETLDRTREVARATAEVTHNHPKGIKGAEAVAAVIFLARNGESKENIKQYVIDEFGYDLSRTCDEIRPGYKFDETCQGTVPEAITAFLEGNSFEDVIRTAASLGGDCDTLTCIAGSMAEALYGVPYWMKSECNKHLTDDILNIVEGFYHAVRVLNAKRHPDDAFAANVYIEDAIIEYGKDPTTENLVMFLTCLKKRMDEDGSFMIPIEFPEGLLPNEDPSKIKIGDTFQLDKDVHLKMRKIQTNDGKVYMVAFTTDDERDMGEFTSSMQMQIEDFLYRVMNMQNADGAIINPWDKPFALTKELLGILFKAMEEEE